MGGFHTPSNLKAFLCHLQKWGFVPAFPSVGEMKKVWEVYISEVHVMGGAGVLLVVLL